jgi:hypothetical protein
MEEPEGELAASLGLGSMKKFYYTRIMFAAWLNASKYMSSLISLGRPRRVEFIILDK